MSDQNNEQKQVDLIISSDELLFALSQLTKLYQRGMYRARLSYVPYRGQYRVLHIIADNDGLNQKELAELLDIRSASMSELLNKLERSTLIKREKDKADKRNTRVFLSDEGRKLVKGSQNQGEFAETLFGGLTDVEKRSYYSVIKSLCATIEAQTFLDDENPHDHLPPHLNGESLSPAERPPLAPSESNPPLPPEVKSIPPEGRPLPPHLRRGRDLSEKK